MDDNGKHRAKVPVILILASFIVVVAGMKAASPPGSFFSGGVHCGHLRSAPILAAPQRCAEGHRASFHSDGYPDCRTALWRIDRSAAESFLEIPPQLSGAIIDHYRYFNKLAARKGH